ncbi:uncharacterized protein LOC129976377 [Argiope bruennichi]|uniref:uncharacterized protein LOC129976369 n=1 Tax=Argiope bruennichi TaxID=94029 RepID=UPI002494F96E|nr:uncharacterized protein LOC129976369 [Argiope bruennichi]XP_055945885.1 uncharacterized protein LOC129976377 [Argiope bruennichi]
MNRAAEFMNSLVVPRSLRGAIRNYIIHRRSGYQEIGAEPDASIWIKLVIYLGTAVVIALSIVSFCNGYVVIPAITMSVVVACAALFWFRNSAIWATLIECSRRTFCFPCNYFARPPPPDVEVRYERRLQKTLSERSTGDRADAEVQTELHISSDASSVYEDCVTFDTNSTKMSNSLQS